jgi:hypothetical protein
MARFAVQFVAVVGFSTQISSNATQFELQKGQLANVACQFEFFPETTITTPRATVVRGCSSPRDHRIVRPILHTSTSATRRTGSPSRAPGLPAAVQADRQASQPCPRCGSRRCRPVRGVRLGEVHRRPRRQPLRGADDVRAEPARVAARARVQRLHDSGQRGRRTATTRRGRSFSFVAAVHRGLRHDHRGQRR